MPAQGLSTCDKGREDTVLEDKLRQQCLLRGLVPVTLVMTSVLSAAFSQQCLLRGLVPVTRFT